MGVVHTFREREGERERPEAVKFIKDICNYFPNNIRAQLKYRMKILLSTYIRRGKRFATEAIRNGLH